MTTQLVGLFFDGKPLDFSTNLNSRHNFHNEMFLAIPSDGHSPLLTGPAGGNLISCSL